MDAKQFLAEFGHIANAPEGVRQLRELILTLAMQGKLFLQDPTDAPASELLEEIAAEKQQLVKTGKLKATKSLQPLKLKEAPYPLPKGWEWIRLGNISKIERGGSPRPIDAFLTDDPNGLNWIKIGDTEKGSKFIASTKEKIKKEGLAKTRMVYPGDFLLTNSMSFGRPYITLIEGCIHDGWLRIHPPANLEKNFLYLLLSSPVVANFFGNSAAGAVVQNLNADKVRDLPIPLPPLAEQARIVAKVDELMALCDKLETQQQQRRNLQNKLRQSILLAVAASANPHELQANWTRLAENLGQLFHEQDDVAGFKGLILDLAVSGQLLKTEHRTSSTGMELLDAIAAKRVAWSRESAGQEQKEALAMLKKLRTQQVTSPDTLLPAHWTWASLLQVSQAVVDCDHKTAPYVDQGIHLIRTTDIRNGQMELTNTRKISEETYKHWARRMPPKSGDIFFTREAPMGEAAIVPAGAKVCLGQRSMLIRLFQDLFSNRFLVYVIQSPNFQMRMKKAAIGMTVKHINVSGVEDLVVPVPPKAEQECIVAIVNKLFSLCDHYATQLSRKQKKAANLATSAIATITGITTESEEDESLKAPKTELIAPLRLGTPPSTKEQAPLTAILAHQNGDMATKDLWQRFGGEIDAFHAQLKLEVDKGWIKEPAE